MPMLNLSGGEPFAETFGVMLFPDDETKRRAWIARHWAGFYPRYETQDGTNPIPRTLLLEVMAEVAAGRVQDAEVRQRSQQGQTVGEWLKVVAAIAHTNPARASWNEAAKLLLWNNVGSRSALYAAGKKFRSVSHLWAAWILRGQKFYESPSVGYTLASDLGIYLTEAMALLEWAMEFRLPRQKAEPLISTADAPWTVPPGWRVPADWMPTTPRTQWPRDGRVPGFSLPPEWQNRLGKQKPKSSRR
jgi:hypothetical protein